MAAEGLDEVIASLKGLPVAAALSDLETYEYLDSNDAADALFGLPHGALLGSKVTSLVAPEDKAAAMAASAALAQGIVDGYQAHRRFLAADGTEMLLTVWGRRVEYANRLYGLWFLLPETVSHSSVTMLTHPSALVLALTDHDWVIEYMSADADLLGSKGSDLRGFPLLGLVHPSVATDFLEAARRVSEEHLTVTIRTRLRVGGAGWAERQCLLIRMCEHHPPRLGVVVTSPTPTESPSHEGPLEQIFRHCAVEGRATETLNALPVLSLLPLGSELSARQTEIVARLIEGQSVSDIARLMFLSSSTVRNHLGVIYRKFDVHSQAELLAVLLRRSAALHR